MKVLHVTPSFAPAWRYGGPTESVYQLCRHLARSGHRVRVLTTDADGRAATLNVPTDREVTMEEGLSVRYCRRLLRHSVSPTLLGLLPSYVRWADVVHLTAVYSFPTIPSLLVCRLSGKPVVWSPRGALQRWERSTRVRSKTVWELFCRLVRPETVVLHATSRAERDACLERLPAFEVRVVANGVTVTDGGSRRAVGSDALRLLYLGRINPVKGIENLLLACRHADSAMGGTWRLNLVGDGSADYVERIRQQVEALGLSEKVAMCGEVRGEGKDELFASADVLVLPSHAENFGMVVAEALAHGVPVIASKGTPWRRLEDVGCGFWVENSPEGLADAIERIWRTAGTRRTEMGRRGQAWMKREFSWADRAAEFSAIYRSVVDSARRPDSAMRPEDEGERP